jgi:hypothetical protein
MILRPDLCVLRGGLGVLLAVSVAIAAGACGSSDSSNPSTPTNPDGGGGPGDGGGGPGDEGGMTQDGGDAATMMDAAPPTPCTLLPLGTKVATLAGCDVAGKNDGARGIAKFGNPTNTLIAPDGTTYVADFDNGYLRAVDAAGNTRTVIKKAEFNRPFGMANAPGGKLYVETDENDMGMHGITNGTLWLVDPVANAATVLKRDIGRPRGLVVLADGKIAMSDYQHHVISVFDPVGGSVTLLAGAADTPAYMNETGANARFNLPYDMVQLPNTDLVVADTGNHRLRRVTLAGVVTDYAGAGTIGNDEGPVATATFDAPQGLAISGSVIYVSDVHRHVIRKIENDMVSTIAGDGTAGFLDADDPKTAKFYGVEGLDVDATRIVIADGNGGDDMPFNHVRVIHLP